MPSTQTTERLVPVRLPAGVYKNGTRYQAKGRWYDANCVRWYEGIMGPVGGWTRVTLTVLGWAPTSAYTAGQLVTDSNGNVQKVTTPGTSGASQPAWNTTVSGTTNDGSVVWTNLGPTGANAAVTGFPRAALAWRPTAAASYVAIGTNTKLYTFTTGQLFDQTPAGLTTGAQNSTMAAGGYGQGGYGQGFYGKGTGAVSISQADTWQLDNFGDTLVACLTSDGKLYQATAGGGAGTQITNAPVACRGVVVTPERFLVALGASGDGRKVQWADQASLTIWGLGQGNDQGAFGQFFLATKGRLMSGRRARLQTFLWTDVDVYTMTFTGGIGVYAFDQCGDNCGLVGPNACTTLGNVAYWMSYNKFFKYDGALVALRCDVIDFLTDDLNFQQRAKIQCVSNAAFDEVIWFYPSTSSLSLENDSYVAYNYRLDHWTIGRLGRSAAVDRGVFDNPIYVDSAGQIWTHEIGNSRTGVGTIFAESGPVEVTDVDLNSLYAGGFSTAFVNRYIPDEKTLGDTLITLFGNILPTDTETQVGPFAAAAPTNTRFRARQVRLRVQENNSVLWRVGVPRLAMTPGGRR